MRIPEARAALLLVTIAVGCGSSTPTAASQAGLAPNRTAVSGARIALIVLENREYDEVIGNDEAPFLNALARRNALATGYHGVTHPSLPNYLALLGGSTFGVSANCSDCLAHGDNLAAQLSRAGVSWRAYFEGMPEPCFGGAGEGEYVKRHNPFMYFPSVFAVERRCRNVVPLDALDADLRRSLPALTWIGPDLCDGGHDCGLPTVDAWLAGLVPRIVRRLGPRGFLVVTFDEGTGGRGCCGEPGGGRVATIVAGPAARRGVRVRRPLDHYALLATIEDALGVPRLRHARGAPTLQRALTD